MLAAFNLLPIPPLASSKVLIVIIAQNMIIV